jgi:hypothetical protein
VEKVPTLTPKLEIVAVFTKMDEKEARLAKSEEVVVELPRRVENIPIFVLRLEIIP